MLEFEIHLTFNEKVHYAWYYDVIADISIQWTSNKWIIIEIKAISIIELSIRMTVSQTLIYMLLLYHKMNALRIDDSGLSECVCVSIVEINILQIIV